MILFFGCSNTKPKMSQIFQSNGATLIKQDYESISILLIDLKKKLDIRNPKQYDKTQSHYILEEIKKGQKTLYLKYNGKYLKHYDEYLKVSFADNTTTFYRNDFLILGLQKLLFESYKGKDNHHFTSLSYDIKKFKKLYYYLKVINWKLKTQKDEKGNYLFLTWQRNWQIELEKYEKNHTMKTIKNLHYIKNGKESLFDPSNFSFEVIMSQILFHIKNSSKIIGEEPIELSIETMLKLVFFL